MNTATHSSLDSAESVRPVDALSAEPARRSIELAFLRRLTDAAKVAGTAVLGKAAEADGDSVSANLARMQSPVFKRAARALEQSVPEDAGFGRFRDRA
jgi:hypothetical protein